MTGSQTLKLVHDRFKGKAPANVLQELTADMASAAKGNREISKHLGMAMEDLSALRVSFLLGDSTVFPSNQWFRVLTRYPTWRGAPAGSGNKRDEKQKQKKVMGETIVAASNASSMPSLALGRFIDSSVESGLDIFHSLLHGRTCHFSFFSLPSGRKC